MTGRGSTDVQRHNGSDKAEDKAKGEQWSPDNLGRFPLHPPVKPPPACSPSVSSQRLLLHLTQPIDFALSLNHAVNGSHNTFDS